ncbi:MAG: D-alanyl-D-alanine carboxypeptidase family protein, partial [Clostridia bacterium]|nr:D-alanyl-D-alanine carboxypeptidase family protein [Clostridia bacterium]
MKNNSVLIGFFAVVIICLVVTCAFLGTALLKSKNPPESEGAESGAPEEIQTDDSETFPESAETEPDETEPAETQPAETSAPETSAPETKPAETEPEGPTFAETLPVEPDRIPEYNGQTWNLFLVNLWNKLPDDFTVDLTYLKSGHAVDSRAYPDLQDMMDDCRAAGLSPLICSSYRTYEKQVTLYDNQVAKYLAKGYTQDQAEKEAAMWVAIPGTSEHHT